MTSLQEPLAKFYPVLAGLIFLCLGVLTLIQPEVLAYYSIGIDNAPARIATRAMIGGGELGLGLVVIGGQRIGLTARQRSLIAASVFLCVGLTRLAAVGLEDSAVISYQPLREAAFEITLAVWGFLAAKFS